MKLLDQYVLRNFFEPFLVCFFGFLGIWLIFDLSDNGPDFLEARATPKQIAQFYFTQLPQTVLISLPVGLLLALLFSLSRMSRFNEVISMLTAGRSILRLLVPLFGVGLLATGACLFLNYELAPHAEGMKKVALERISRGRKDDKNAVDGTLFRDRMNGRTWYIRKLKPNSTQLEGVHITQQDEQGRITKKWYAARAAFAARGKTWTLSRGMICEFNDAGDIAAIDHFPTGHRVVGDWSETPWRIASAHLEAQNLSIPELRDYLKYNADFPAPQLAPFRTYLHHRWALPWSCLVVVCIAAPLGIVFTRRGVLGGVASSIFIFFGMIFLTNLFLALGKGARVSPWLAAWLPNLSIALVGLVLLYFRSTNRDLASLFARR